MSLPALAKGYAIVYADYQGPNSDFAAGKQSAHAVLDGAQILGCLFTTFSGDSPKIG